MIVEGQVRAGKTPRIGGLAREVNDLTPLPPRSIMRYALPCCNPLDRTALQGIFPGICSLLTRAVLFDFDGVIADSENIHIAAWERTFALLGWDVEPEECEKAVEQDDRAFLAAIFAERSVDDGDITGWVQRKQEITRTMLAASPRVYPGVHELVAALKGKAQLAVVSGTWRENVQTVLRAANLEDAFSVIVAKEDVKQPKPSPDAYKLALKKLRIPADSAVAIEDSPTGLSAARKAGLAVVAVGHRRPSPEWAGDAFFSPDLLGLVSLRGWFD